MDFQMEDLTDYLRSGALIIAVVITIFMNDRSRFINFHIIANLGFGVAFAFFPKYIAGFQVAKELGEKELICSGLFGMSLIAASIVWVLTRDTRDGTVPITLMTAQVFSSSVILLCQLYTQFGKTYKENPWTPQHISFGMLGAFGLFVTNLVYLLRSHDFTGYPQHNIRVNEFLRLDAGLSMLLALTLIAFPELLFTHFWASNPTYASKHFVRCAGAMVLNTAFVSLQAAGFLHEKDKKQQFIGRLIGTLLLFAPFMFAAAVNGTFTLQQIEWALLVVLPLVINGVLGYMAGGTIMYSNKYK